MTLVAEQGKLLLHVADVQGRPVAHLTIAPSGAGGGAQETDATGRVLLLLAPETKANSLVQLQIVRSPSGHDFVMFDPWREHPVRVPPFEGDAMNFVSVVVAERGDRAMLENPRALAAQIAQANAPKTASKQAFSESPKESLDSISKQYGLAPNEVDRAIRAWGTKATDPYDAGLAALYERNYPEATKQLTASLESREEMLRRDRKKDEDAVVEAASSLGQSLYAQALYKQALLAEDRVLEIRPNDAITLNQKALCLAELGLYREAETLLHKVIDMAKKQFGDNHINTLNTESNLAAVLEREGSYFESGRIFFDILNKRLLVPDCSGAIRSTDLNNLAEVFLEQGHYANAEQFVVRAAIVDEDAPNSEEWNTIRSLVNLGYLLMEHRNYAGATIVLERALVISQAIYGTNHQAISTVLNNLGSVQASGGMLSAAESSFRESLRINKQIYGSDHPDTANSLNNLGNLLIKKGEMAEAKRLLRQALDIDERTLGPEHPRTAIALTNLGLCLEIAGNYTEAERMYLRAISIDEKALGPENSATKIIQNNLASMKAKLK